MEVGPTTYPIKLSAEEVEEIVRAHLAQRFGHPVLEVRFRVSEEYAEGDWRASEPMVLCFKGAEVVMEAPSPPSSPEAVPST